MTAVSIPSVQVFGNTMKFTFPTVQTMKEWLPTVTPSIEDMSDEELRTLLQDLKISRKEKRAIRKRLKPLASPAKPTEKRYKIMEVVTSVMAVLLFIPQFAFAAPEGGFSVEKAFMPLIELIRDIANPICYVMFIIGFIYVMIGRANEGFKRMQYASFGYIGVQLAPGLMNIIKGVGMSMAM